MKTLAVKFGQLEDGLHMRPAALVVRMANLCKYHDLRLHRNRSGKGDKADLKSIIGIVGANIYAGENWWLTVSGPKEAVVASLVQIFLTNLHLAAELFSERSSTKTARANRELQNPSSEAGVVLIIKRMLETVSDFNVENGDNKYAMGIVHDVAEMLQSSDARDIARSEGILNSPKGLHVVSAQILALVAGLYKSRITLTFLNKIGNPESCNASEPFEILSVEVTDRTKIGIRAKGPDSQVAVVVVKNILEKMATIEEAVHSQKAGLHTKSALIEFLRRILKLGPHELPSP